MDLQPWQLIASVFGGGAGGGVLTKGLDVLGKRTRSQAYTMGAVDHAVQTAMGITTDRLEKTEARLDFVEAQHEDCERNLREVRGELSEITRDRDELKAAIDRLMSGDIPGYAPRAP